MKKFVAVCVLGLLVIASNSCKNDLDALAPYKESIAVYSLIDQNDSVNYIRVNKIFLGQGDANQIAQIQDSVYFKPGEATVYIEKYWNDVKKQTYIFSETYEKPLQPGTFNTNQLIYKSTQKFKSDSVGKYFEYRLVVKNNTSGKEFNSKRIKLIKDIVPSNPGGALCSNAIGSNCFINSEFVSLLSGATARTKVQLTAPVNSAICGFRIQLHYHSLFTDNSTAKRTLTLDHGQEKLDIISNGQTLIDFSFGGQQFHKDVYASIPDETNLTQRTLDSLQFIFTFAGEELKFYQEINGTSGSFGQEKPIYTNMEGDAIGLFSSRAKASITRKFWDFNGGPNQTKTLNYNSTSDFMYNSISCRLKFRAANWSIPNC